MGAGLGPAPLNSIVITTVAQTVSNAFVICAHLLFDFYAIYPAAPVKEHMQAICLDPGLRWIPGRRQVYCYNNRHPPKPDFVGINSRSGVSQGVEVVVGLEQRPIVQHELHAVHIVEKQVCMLTRVVASFRCQLPRRRAIYFKWPSTTNASKIGSSS